MANGMRRFTTPTLEITLRWESTKELATDLEFDYVLMTIDNEGQLIEREIPKSQFENATTQVRFTQEETGSLKVGTSYEVELNIMIGEDRIGTAIQRFEVKKNLHNEVILT